MAGTRTGHPSVVGCAPSLTHVEVRSLACSPPPSADLVRLPGRQLT